MACKKHQPGRPCCGGGGGNCPACPPATWASFTVRILSGCPSGPYTVQLSDTSTPPATYCYFASHWNVPTGWQLISAIGRNAEFLVPFQGCMEVQLSSCAKDCATMTCQCCASAERLVKLNPACCCYGGGTSCDGSTTPGAWPPFMYYTVKFFQGSGTGPCAADAVSFWTQHLPGTFAVPFAFLGGASADANYQLLIASPPLCGGSQGADCRARIFFSCGLNCDGSVPFAGVNVWANNSATNGGFGCGSICYAFSVIATSSQSEVGCSGRITRPNQFGQCSTNFPSSFVRIGNLELQW